MRLLWAAPIPEPRIPAHKISSSSDDDGGEGDDDGGEGDDDDGDVDEV